MSMNSSLSSGLDQYLQSPLAHRRNTFLEQYPTQSQALGSASHEALVNSNNAAYLQTQLDLLNQQQSIASLEQENKDLRQEVEGLTVKLDTTNDILEKLIVRSTVTLDNLSVPSLPLVKTIPLCIPKTKCPKVSIYKAEEQQNGGGNTNGLAQVPAKPGCPTKDNPATPYPYLLNRNGKVVDSNYANNFTAKQALQTWGKGAGQVVQDYVYSELLKDSSLFKPLLLAEDYWKINAFLIDYYCAWARNNLKDSLGNMCPAKRLQTQLQHQKTPQ
ncbi:hypothetical protein V5O48_017321 [Marasmius crinis-equi]|uniref:Uncharacterized protein n=1 Tax=Marasmius crinis-equi TaxID=585013 RepID=A0ABR3EP91_9AGAR